MMARARTTTKAMVATATKEIEMASRIAKAVVTTTTISSSARVAISVSQRVAGSTKTEAVRDSNTMTTSKSTRVADRKEVSVVQTTASTSAHR